MGSMREASWAIVLLLLVPVPSSATATTHVHIIGSFDPQRVEVLPRDTLEWDNHGSVTHTVTDATCTANPPSSCAYDETVGPGATFSHAFDEPGVFEFRCRIHGFTGRVVVADPPGVLPDLTVEQLSVTDALAFGVPMPSTKRISVVLANLGDGSAPGSLLRIGYQYNGAWHTIGVAWVDDLGPGEAATLNASWPVLGKVGDFPVRAIADGSDQVQESRESNNERREIVALVVPAGVAHGVDLLEP